MVSTLVNDIYNMDYGIIITVLSLVFVKDRATKLDFSVSYT